MRLFDNSAIRIDLFPGRKEKRDGKNNKNVTARSNEPRVANARVPQGTKLQKDGPGSSSVKTAKSLQNMNSVASQRPDTTRAYNSYDAEKSGAGYSNNKGASSSYTYQRPSMDRANHDAEPRTSEQKGPWLLQRGESPLVNRVEMSRNKQQAEQRPNATDHGYFAGQSGMNREPNGSSSRQRDEPPAAAHRTEMNRNNHAEQWTTPTGYGNPTGQSTTDVDRSGLSSRQRNDSSPADRPETNRNNHAQQRTTATADGQYSIPSTMRSESERPSRDQRRSRADIQDEIEADQKLRTNIPLGAPHSTGHALKHKRSKADMIRATENMARTLSRSPHRSPANKRQREVADDARPGTSSSNGSYQQTQFSRSNSNTRAPYGVSPTNSHGTARDNSHSRQRSVDTNGQNAYRTQTPDGSKATNGADNASPQYDGLSPTKVSSVAKKQGKAFNSTIRTSPPLPMEPNKTTWSPTSSVARKKSSERQNNGRQKNVSANSAGHQRQYSHSRNHAGTQAGSTLRQPDQSTGPSERGHERTMSNGVADSKSDTRSDDNWSSVNQPNQCQCGRSAPGGSNVQVGPELANTSHVNDTRETQHHENNDMEQGSSYGADANTSTNTRRSSTAGNENDDNSNSTTHPTYMNFSRPSNSDLRAEKPNNVNPVAANAQATGSNGTGQGRSEPTPPATTSVDFAAANQAAKQQQQQQQQQPKNNAIQSNATQNGPTSKPQKSKYVDAGSSTESPWQKTFGGGRAGGDPRTKVPNHIIGQQQPQSKNPFAAHMRNGSSNSNPSPNKFSNTNAIVNNLSNSSHSAVAQKNKPIPQPLPLGGGKKKENSTTSSSSSSHRAKVVTVDDKGGNNTVVPTPRSSKLSPDRQSDGHDNVKVVTINNGGGSLARNSPEGENNNSASPHQGVSSNGGGSGNPNGYDSTTDQGRTNSSQSDSMDFGGQSTYSNNKQSQRNGRQPDHPNNDNDYNKGYLDSAVDNVGSVMRDVGQKISGGNWNTAQTVGGR